jgi:hypothetical protein
MFPLRILNLGIKQLRQPEYQKPAITNNQTAGNDPKSVDQASVFSPDDMDFDQAS